MTPVAAPVERLVVALVVLLTACETSPDGTGQFVNSTPNGGGIAPGSSAPPHKGPAATFLDNGCNTVVDNCEFHTYDLQGHLLSSRFDFYCDELLTGPLDSCTSVIERSGGIERREVDFSCDGTVDYCDTYTHGSAEELLSIASDHGCDGTDPLDYCATSRYDANGNVVENLTDLGCDDSIDGCQAITNIYDVHHVLKQANVDMGCNGQVDACQSFEYDAEGREVYMRQDLQCDGTFDACFGTLYD